jgi:hypothetical protein
MKAFAFVLKSSGQIVPATISETPRAAIVNALCVVAMESVTKLWTDDHINGAYKRWLDDKGDIRTVNVEIDNSIPKHDVPDPNAKPKSAARKAKKDKYGDSG